MIFRPRLALALVPTDPGMEFSVGETHFRAVSETYLTAFYDSVRDHTGSLVALEITPVEGAEQLVGLLAPFEYVHSVDEGRRARVFFAPRVRGLATSSAEQAFGGRIYRSPHGQLAISLDLDWLENGDIQAIRSSTAQWVNLDSHA